MSAYAPVPKDHPLMLAWEKHKATDDYANSHRWAGHLAHRDGSLWALFSAGWSAAIESQAAQIAALKTVMVAAAEEIAAHWNAHCDAEGYGPQNLLRRLEEGIPSEYGYTAGAFAALTAERDALRAYYRASKNLQLTMGHPDATAQDEQAAEDAYAKASSDAARTQAHKPANKGQTL